MTPREAAHEAAANSLHQHGPTTAGPQTADWRDCTHAAQHEGAGRDAADAVLAAAGYDDVLRQRDDAVAARERLRNHLNALRWLEAKLYPDGYKDALTRLPSDPAAAGDGGTA